MATLAVALEALDAAIGRPYEAGPMRVRTAAWLHACRHLPEAAITWATETACARLEKYPTAAQFKALAQGSPAYRALLEQRRPTAPPPEAPDVMRCAVCQEPRAYHRVRPFPDAPRPLVIRGIRHRYECAHALDVQWWVDPPLFGELTEGSDAWRTSEPSWEPTRGGKVTALDGTPAAADNRDRAARAQAYKDAALDRGNVVEHD